MKKSFYLLAVLFMLVVVGCSREDVQTPLPQVNELNANISTLPPKYSLTMGKGKYVAYYLVDNERVEPGEVLQVGEGGHLIEAFTMHFDNGTYNRFSHWSDGVTNNKRFFYVLEDMKIEAYFENQTELIIVPEGLDKAEIELEGYGTMIIPGQYGGLPTDEEVVATAVVPSGYEFVKWHDGVTSPSRTLKPSPFFVNRVYYKAIEEWDSNKQYQKGNRVYYKNLEYIAKWICQGEVPGENTYNAWEEVVVGNEWSATKEYQAGDVVTYEGREYIAKWWTRGIAPTEADSGFELK